MSLAELESMPRDEFIRKYEARFIDYWRESMRQRVPRPEEGDYGNVRMLVRCNAATLWDLMHGMVAS